MRIKAVLADLDGTLYDSRQRQDKHLRGEKKDFDAFHADAHLDQPQKWCVELIKAMVAQGYFPLFVSGRDDTYQDLTIDWINRQFGYDLSFKLIMRAAKDYTADDVLKEKIYRELIEPHYDVLFCIDDRKRVVDMWRRVGLVCLHCDHGDF